MRLLISLWWRRLTHRLDPAQVDEAYILAAAARAKSPMIFRDEDAPIPYRITEAGRAMLRDAQQSSPDRQQGE